MPRPQRTAGPPHTSADETPTRTAVANAITATIPPFMLQTPPHAPFVTTPLPHSNTRAHSIVPPGPGNRQRHLRHTQQHTPAGNGNTQDRAPDPPQSSNHALESAASDGPNDEHSLLDSVPHDPDDAKQLIGLKDISSLATWTLSSSKPGCALPQLRHPSPSYFWQSDGPQPHTLTLYFFKLVAIVKMRIYLDFELDESYTPTKMRFFAGMSEGGLVEFGSWEAQETTDPDTGEVHSGVEGIGGWMDVPLKGVGGRDTRYHDGVEIRTRSKGSRFRQGKGIYIGHTAELLDEDGDADMDVDDFVGGDVLKAMVVQVRICENHQNGKDTHVRGFQVFARDENQAKEVRRKPKKNKDRVDGVDEESDARAGLVGLEPAEWMRDPEIR